MRFLLGTIALIALTTAALFAGGTREAWTQVADTAAVRNVNVAGFATPETGFGVGYAGNAVHTTDGGAHWSSGIAHSMCRFGLEVVSETVAYSFGNGGNVRVTLDGGDTWQSRPSFGDGEPTHIRFASFIDASSGWAAAPLLLGVTEDQGATWRVLPRPEGAGATAGIACLSVSSGYLLDTRMVLRFTEDGGATWTERGSVIDPAAVYRNPNAFTPQVALRFFDADHGLFAYSSGPGEDSRWNFLVTSDGGRTWTEDSTVEAPIGTPFLSRDGTLLTILRGSGQVALFLRNG